MISLKALLVGALTIILIQHGTRLFLGPWMMARIVSLEPPIDAPPTMSVADYIQSQMWPLFALSLSISVVSYLAGGYAVGKLADRGYFLNATLAVVVVMGVNVVVDGRGLGQAPEIFVSLAAIWTAFALLGCFAGRRLGAEQS